MVGHGTAPIELSLPAIMAGNGLVAAISPIGLALFSPERAKKAMRGKRLVVANACGVTRKTVDRWPEGTRKPSCQMICALARVLGGPVDSLLTKTVVLL